MWEVIVIDGERHVIPQNDRRLHETTRGCWCEPRDHDGVVVHNSQDRREMFEKK